AAPVINDLVDRYRRTTAQGDNADSRLKSVRVHCYCSGEAHHQSRVDAETVQLIQQRTITANARRGRNTTSVARCRQLDVQTRLLRGIRSRQSISRKGTDSR